VPSQQTLKGPVQTAALADLTHHPELFAQLLVTGIAKLLVAKDLKSPLAVKGLSFRSFPVVDLLTMLAENHTLVASELKHLLRVGPESYARRTLLALKKE